MLANYITEDTPVITINNLKLAEAQQLAQQLKIDKHTLAEKNNWVSLKNQWYYFKKDDPRIDGSINELIGQYITKHFGLTPVFHQIGKFENDNQWPITEYGLLSKNFRDPNKIYHRIKKGPDKNYPITYLDHLQKYKELSEDLKRLIIRDLYASETDRQYCNILIEQEKGSQDLRLAPIFDNELSLNVVRSRYSNFLFLIDLNDPSVKAYMKKDPLFQELLDKVQSFSMKNVLNQIQETHHLKFTRGNRENWIHYDRDQKRNIYKKTR